MFDAQPFSPAKKPSRASSYASRSVWFAATDADQLLLQTIDHLLDAGDYSSFSDLCKQALRSWLLPEEPQPDPTLALLQQQVVALQLQVNQLSQELSQPASTAPTIALEQQMAALITRVARLEQDRMQEPESSQSVNQSVNPLTGQLTGQSAESRSVAERLSSPLSATPPESDPLLDRLVALLEDF